MSIKKVFSSFMLILLSINIYAESKFVDYNFIKCKNNYIGGYNVKAIEKTDVDRCASSCLSNSWCNSFDFDKSSKKCYLQNNPSHVTLLPS